VPVTDDADRAFLDELADQVEAWLEEGQSGSPELPLAPTTSFRRLLTYQLLSGERFARADGAAGGGHPGFVVRKVERRGGATGIVLCRAATPEAAAELQARQQQEARDAVHDAAGFAAVFDMMRASGKPAGAFWVLGGGIVARFPVGGAGLAGEVGVRLGPWTQGQPEPRSAAKPSAPLTPPQNPKPPSTPTPPSGPQPGV
jgi:hypothetical protein